MNRDYLNQWNSDYLDKHAFKLARTALIKTKYQ
ncbi:hypothetical protein NOS3756_06320 [Nostoc sp. NIES-3756]|nr:hypothetical protein NOS3756_06320 [Nostoc sp. NIES-3756]BAY40581.1 hypothetical protein NIES2111_49680 [Nostoc sp. NIES-2111]